MIDTFKVIVAGSRTFNNFTLLKSKLDHLLQYKTNIEIVSGSCDTGTLTFNRPDGTAVCGADGLGEKWAMSKGYDVKYFPANWSDHGRAAGPLRNEEMAQYVYAGNQGGCIVFWDGVSKGSQDMILKARKYNINLKIIKY